MGGQLRGHRVAFSPGSAPFVALALHSKVPAPVAGSICSLAMPRTPVARALHSTPSVHGVSARGASRTSTCDDANAAKRYSVTDGVSQTDRIVMGVSQTGRGGIALISKLAKRASERVCCYTPCIVCSVRCSRTSVVSTLELDRGLHAAVIPLSGRHYLRSTC